MCVSGCCKSERPGPGLGHRFARTSEDVWKQERRAGAGNLGLVLGSMTVIDITMVFCVTSLSYACDSTDAVLRDKRRAGTDESAQKRFGCGFTQQERDGLGGALGTFSTVVG